MGLVIALAGLLFLFDGDAVAAPFPDYPAIRPNIKFWKSVYSRYSSTQGIVHDNRNLNIVYEIITLKHPDAAGARRINRERIRKVKEKYRNLLIGLARGTSPQTDEARRVADLFGSHKTASFLRRSAGRIRCQVGQKDRFREGIIRSGAYLKTIQRILERKKLPLALSYLPHVESSFNTAAYSKFGAAGMWQFTRSTGRRYLRVNYVVDERRDPILSTYAAARLLSDNYEKLGSWPLALTAYNHGANGMARAKRTHGGYEAIFNHYQSRTFKFASRNFYSEFLAACEVAKNYQQYFGALTLHRPALHSVLKVPGFVDLKSLADYIGLDPVKIRRLNPALRNPVFRGEKYIPKGYALRLPRGIGKRKNLLTAGLPPELVRSKQKRSRFHRVSRGDTAGKIARLNGVSIKSLVRANNLNSRATVYAGQHLVIPAAGTPIRVAGLKEPVKKPEKPMIPAKKKKPRPKPIPQPLSRTPAPLPVVEQEQSINPRVVTGDFRVKRIKGKKERPTGAIRVAVEETLGHYADWLQVPTQSIRRLNGLPYGRVLKIHQTIKIPLGKISRERFEEKRLEYHQEILQDFFNVYRVDRVQRYRIKAGDNIWLLCKEVFDVPLWLFMTYNDGIDPDALKTSQTVTIPIVEKITSG